LLKIQDILANQYKINKNLFYNFYLSVKKRKENTTRSRSLLFFSTAVLIGSTYDSTNLIIPENGFISLNVPLVPYRSGSNSTRTTHPLYMNYFNDLLKSIKINITMANPYQFKTKGRMMIECKNQKLLINYAKDTMSCSHPKVTRFYKEPAMNCGYCLPCIVRKGAFKKSKIKDDKYLGDKHDIKKLKINLDTYKRGIYEFDTKDYHATTVIKNGRLPGSVEKYISVYTEGMKEIKEVIKEMK
jgi:hypothetical protein